ncbi:hypothetical protein RFI_00765, partial [Reticulomyxa filosa]
SNTTIATKTTNNKKKTKVLIAIVEQSNGQCYGGDAIPITTNYQPYLLQLLNQHRSQISNGSLYNAGYRSSVRNASSMNTLLWDYELANISQWYSNQCCINDLGFQDINYQTKMVTTQHNLSFAADFNNYFVRTSVGSYQFRKADSAIIGNSTYLPTLLSNLKAVLDSWALEYQVSKKEKIFLFNKKNTSLQKK